MKTSALRPSVPVWLTLAGALLCCCLAQAAEQPSLPAARKPAWDVNHPPGEVRTVSIDPRSGTWMSVDVSPDGQTLLFDLLGDLYTLPITGGRTAATSTTRRTARPAAASSTTRTATARSSASAARTCRTAAPSPS